MSTSRIRHRGHPARDVQHGPANGAGGSTLIGAHAEVARIAQAEASRLVEVGGRMPDGGAGRIERSMATEAQREVWRAEAKTPTQRVPVKAKLEVDGSHAKGSAEERAATSKARQAAYLAREAPEPVARPALGSREHMQQSRMRGGERNRQLVAAAQVLATVTGQTVTANTIEEEPAMAIEPPAVVDVELITPCARCAHEAVCSIRATLTPGAVQMLSVPLHEALIIRAPNVVLDCTEFLDAAAIDFNAKRAYEHAMEGSEREEDPAPAVGESGADYSPDIPEPADDAPEVVTRQASRDVADAAVAADVEADRTRKTDRAPGGGPGKPLTAQEERIVRSATRHGGTIRDVAADLGISGSNVRASLERIGRKGGLPLELIAKLPAGYAKYTGV